MLEPVVPVRVGQNVPDFTIETYDPVAGDFAKFSLADQKKGGRWTVLFFYPADFTFVCATEFEALADHQDHFKKLGCDIVTMSKDTKFTHLAWHAHEKELKNVKYVMGSDNKGEVGRMLGCLDEGSGLTLRGTYLISPQGVLTASEVNFYNVGRNVEELMRKFKANLYLSKKPTEVCPAKWKDEGDKTLSPSARMVGKVHEALHAR
jgi:peroxiredoxin (alkyl hydroperoxide reductase subunit C)